MPATLSALRDHPPCANAVDARLRDRRRAKEARSRTRRLPRRQRQRLDSRREAAHALGASKETSSACVVSLDDATAHPRTNLDVFSVSPSRFDATLGFFDLFERVRATLAAAIGGAPHGAPCRSNGDPPRRGGGGCRRGGRRRDPRVPLLGRVAAASTLEPGDVRRRTRQGHIGTREASSSRPTPRARTAVSETAASGARAVATGAGTAATRGGVPGGVARTAERCDADGEPVVIDERARFGAEALFLSSLASSALAVAVIRALAARDGAATIPRDVASEASRDLEGIARGTRPPPPPGNGALRALRVGRLGRRTVRHYRKT